MSRKFCIPGVIFLLAATVLSFLVAIGLPYLTALDIARTHYEGPAGSGDSNGVAKQVRFGTWASCAYMVDGDRTCQKAHNAYLTVVQSPTNDIAIGRGWTRGLAVHPVAAGVTFLALLASLSVHVTVQLVASLLSFLAALITLIAFAIDISLFVKVNHEMKKLDNVNVKTNTAPGFWMTFAALLLTLLAGFTVCFGRRRERMYHATTQPSTYPMTGKRSIFSRFRRN